MYKEPSMPVIGHPFPKVLRVVPQNTFLTDEGVTIKLERGTIAQEQVTNVIEEVSLMKFTEII